MRIILIGDPYLTQSELKEGEQRALYSKVYTTEPDKFRAATEADIEQVRAAEQEVDILPLENRE